MKQFGKKRERKRLQVSFLSKADLTAVQFREIREGNSIFRLFCCCFWVLASASVVVMVLSLSCNPIDYQFAKLQKKREWVRSERAKIQRNRNVSLTKTERKLLFAMDERERYSSLSGFTASSSYSHLERDTYVYTHNMQ